MDYEKVILTIISVVAFLGNTVTVMLFIRKSKWLKKAYNCLILALAVQDILVAIFLMVLPGAVMEEDAYRLPSNEGSRLVFCKTLWSQYLPFALGITSVYTCLMLTFDRWLAVAKPLSYKKYEQSSLVVICTLIFPWIAGFCLELTAPLNATAIEVNGTARCAWKKKEDSSETIAVALFTFLGMIVIPGTLMVLAYCRIIVHMKLSQKRVSVAPSSSMTNTQANKAYRSLKRVTLTACFASAVVIVCWLPDQLYYALSHVEVTELGTTIHFALKGLAFASSCVNPIIYCFSNNAYRNGLKELFGCLCCKEQSLVSEFSMVENTKS